MTSTSTTPRQAPAAPPEAPAAPTPGRTGAILALVLVGYFMVILDNSIVITGLPHIRSELGLDAGGTAWVQDAYLLTFGGLLLLGARAGDLLGRRRTFVLGLVLFALASVAVGLAPTGAWLIGARAVQGLAFGPLTASGIARVTPDRAGAASGVVNSVHQLGGALGTSLVLAVSATYPGAMLVGAALLAGALVAALGLVLPGSRQGRA